MHQFIFKRNEIKYLITDEQKDLILKAIDQYMKQDKYGVSTIRNIYFDTLDYRLIRRSIEKPLYKEKLRIRSYKQVDENEKIFIEMKKKYKSVVYKRRIKINQKEALKWVCENIRPNDNSQIANEIDYFIKFYKGLKPIVFLSYDREAYYSIEDEDLRITFDSNILYRTNDLSFDQEIYGTSILDKDKIIMEVKSSKGMPLWLTSVLSELKIYKTSYSKYGTAYQDLIFKNRGGIV